MTDADYADDLELPTNTPTQTEWSKQQETLVSKTEFMCFKEAAFSTLNVKPLILVE